MAESNGNQRDLELREYQRELLEAAKEKNIIVCLGTGTGKTFISIKLIEHLARVNDIFRPFSQGAKRTFFLVNSVPLVFQQAKAIKDNTALSVKPFCGEMGVDFWSKEEWLKEFEDNHVLVMTHQIYLDLIQHAKLKLSQANLLVFDECHHAHKNHPFKKIMDCFAHNPVRDHHPRILGLTASVVSTKVKPHQIGDEIKKLEHTLRSVCKTASDPNVVEKYGAKPKEIMHPYSSSNNMDEIAKYLECEFRSVLVPLQVFLQDMKVVKQISGSEETILKELDVAKSAVRECLSALEDIGIWAAYEVSMMLVDDLEKRSKKVSNGTASLILQTTVTSLHELGLKYNEFRIANLRGQEKIQQEYLKPKVKELLNLFASKSQDDRKVCSIVFVERRYAACVVSKLINTLVVEGWPEYRNLNSDFVTGHGSDLWGISETEMNFNTQKEKLKKFKDGDFNVLVGTSVVEEGVDIPKCNLVVMFDFPNNYRAFVQSRGRGRAKNAQYVLLVKRDEFARRRQEQQMYQHVDKYLTELCQRNRDEPTDEEALEAVNVYPLENYFTERNAILDMGNSIPLLYRYCSKLPCDRFTSLKPLFTVYDVGDDEFQCSLKMPGNSHVTGIIKGDPMPSKKEAKQAVAYIACKMLHEYEALDEHLLPGESSSESESEDEIDGPSQHKTGTRKRQRQHTVKTSKQVYGGLTTDGSKEVYVYIINMKFDKVYNKLKKNKLWDKKEVSLGIITNVKLPEQLPSFSLYNDIGKLTVDIDRRRSITVAMTSKQRELVDWFHRFIFTETLEFKLGWPTANGCRVVLLNCEDNHPMTSRHLSASAAGINFDEMELLKEKVLKSDGRVSSDTDLLDSVVIRSYSRNPGHYMVTLVTQDNPCSRFPNQCKAGTFEEYFEKNYYYKTRDRTQQLLEVVNHSRRIDCRRSQITRKCKTMQLIPEMLEFRKSSQSLTLRALFLPAILYRVDSLVSMSELQSDIDLASNLSCYTSSPESPLKKLKSSEEAGTSQSTTKKPSSLSRYFYPFDSSKSVPLFKLLEAVTCASSGDDFNLERLEMLGDSFLKMAVSIHVYWHKDHKDEGKLTKYRTRQISNKNLFKLSEQRNLSRYIKYSMFTKETWVPPGFTPAQSKLQNGNLSLSSDDDFDFITDDITDDKDDDVIDGHDVMKQVISDKSIADSMEALIGAHFIHCGYMGALGFMTWLGVDVLHTEDEEPTNEGRRKSPTPHRPSAYANYPLPTLDPPTNEDSARYEVILNRETKEMASFEKKIGYKFKNKVLLLEAFTHPTYNENTITGSYQRLEFLGDAILDFLVTQHIYNNSETDLTPGQLTDLRSALVNNNIFAVIAVNNDYHKYLKEYSPTLFSTIGHFVEGVQQYQQNLGRKVIPDPYVIAVQSDSSDVECIEAPKPLGDVFESVAGAIFLDSGLNIHEVWRVCYPLLKEYIDEYSKNVPKNPVRSVKELDGDAKFSSAKNMEDGRISCVLTCMGREYEGIGRNKHNAKLSAAYKALKRTDYKH